MAHFSPNRNHIPAPTGEGIHETGFRVEVGAPLV